MSPDLKHIEEMLQLPWDTILVLSSGYAGYFVANIGAREHHKSVDVIFSTIVFGFFSYCMYVLLRSLGVPIHWASLLAFSFALILGGIWSKLGRRFLGKVLRTSGVAFTDDLPSAWGALFRQTDVVALQLSVRLTDGTWLLCQDLSDFANLPNGPCVLGASGDVLMYVTHKKTHGGDEFISTHRFEEGFEITYLPKEQIAQIDLLRTSRRSTFSGLGASRRHR